MSINTNDLEKEILNNIESLITIISKISQAEANDSRRYLLEAEYYITKTNPLLENLLQKKDLPLEQIYRQLISQKLPSSPLSNSIDNLEQMLEIIFTLPIFQKENKKEPLTNISEETTSHHQLHMEKNNFSEKSKVSLYSFITALFPREKILKNYYVRSIKLDYFLPRKKLAVLLTPVYFRRSISLNMLILREGLHLIEISPQDLNNPQQLYRKFSQQAI